jgi:hypothetical protein
MSLRKIESIVNNSTGLTATVYRDSEWQEYRVKFHQDGKHLADSDYHTDDKSDAQHTARTVWSSQPQIPELYASRILCTVQPRELTE